MVKEMKNLLDVNMTQSGGLLLDRHQGGGKFVGQQEAL